MSVLPPERGCKIALIVTVGFAIGVTVGALLGGLGAYWYVDPPWSRPAPGTSTVQPLRESLAGMSALIGLVVGAPIGGLGGAIVGGIVSWIHTRRQSARFSSAPPPPFASGPGGP